jgi:lysophospholipase L1-like esterase
VFRPGGKAEVHPQGTLKVRDWSFYCERVKEAIEAALGANVTVVVVTEPFLSEEHIDQQRTLRGMLDEYFSNEPRVSYVDLGSVIDTNKNEFVTDGLHLNAKGNRLIAERLFEVITELK